MPSLNTYKVVIETEYTVSAENPQIAAQLALMNLGDPEVTRVGELGQVGSCYIQGKPEVTDITTRKQL